MGSFPHKRIYNQTSVYERGQPLLVIGENASLDAVRLGLVFQTVRVLFAIHTDDALHKR